MFHLTSGKKTALWSELARSMRRATFVLALAAALPAAAFHIPAAGGRATLGLSTSLTMTGHEGLAARRPALARISRMPLSRRAGPTLLRSSTVSESLPASCATEVVAKRGAA